jgi:hypothetical protein
MNSVDKMSNEEFEEILNNIESYDDIENQDDENNEKENNKHFEDTDHFDEDDSSDTEDVETDSESDDLTDETTTEDEDEEDIDNGENSQGDDEKEDSTGSDDPSMKNEEIDYKKAYEEAIREKDRYENFYKEATSEFVANGRTIKGITDPKKIIQAQQMAAGYVEKMRNFKKYRPFMTSLKEKGILEDPDKFNLMMNAIDGDKEAIKTILKSSEVDPLELDMENINYEPKNQITSDIELSLKDVIDDATQYGVRNQVEKVIGEEWDDDSVIELLENPENSSDLIKHISSGLYDLVQERIAQKKITDTHGVYSNKKAIDQYREAVSELEEEYLESLKDSEHSGNNNNSMFNEAEIQAEIQRIKEENEYRRNVEKRNRKVEEQRKRAASVSTKKPRTRKRAPIKTDVLELDDKEFEDILNSFMA